MPKWYSQSEQVTWFTISLHVDWRAGVRTEKTTEMFGAALVKDDQLEARKQAWKAHMEHWASTLPMELTA